MTQPSMPPEAHEHWLGTLESTGEPRYLQILHFLERAIGDGRLKAGDRLPPQRRVAEQLGVDLTTVTRAYREATQRRLIRPRGTRGTFVAASRRDLAPMVDLGMNIPPTPAGIDLGEQLRQGLSQVLVHHDAGLLMTYRHGGGGKADRRAGARWLSQCLDEVDPARVVVCPGAQTALAAALVALTQPGDTILTEPLVYPGFLAVARQLGRRLASVDTDDQGMRPDALESALAERRGQLVYLNPTLHNPTTRTMGASRRRDIADLVKRHHARILEDDPYWLLADDAPRPVAALAPDHTYYIWTLSKCISPGLRIAYTYLPERRDEHRFLTALHAVSLMPAPLSQALVTQWIDTGVATELVAAVRAEARTRLQIARRILPEHSTTVTAGIHLWCALPDHWTMHELVTAARAEGMALAPSDAFQAGTSSPTAIRISLGAAPDHRLLAQALEKLAHLMRGREGAGHGVLV